MDGRTSKWTGVENVIGELCKFALKVRPKRMIAHSSSTDLEIIMHFNYLTVQEKMTRSSSKSSIFTAFLEFRMNF